MTTKIKTTLLTAFFLFGLLTGLQAQDKYEFAIVTQWNNTELRVSIEGKPYEVIPLPKDVKSSCVNGKLFEYISKMQNEGWEVFNNLSSYSNNLTVSFILRKKKN